MILIVTTPFPWAHRGVDVQHFELGQHIDTDTHDPELVTVATKLGLVQPADTVIDDDAVATEALPRKPRNSQK